MTYRFRVVAIYSNNDNRHGPSSKRITVGSATDHWTKVLVPGPIIVEARPLSSSEIFIGWQVTAIYYYCYYYCRYYQRRIQKVWLVGERNRLRPGHRRRRGRVERRRREDRGTMGEVWEGVHPLHWGSGEGVVPNP